MVFISFVHYLYDIKIDEINVNYSVMVLFNKKIIILYSEFINGFCKKFRESDSFS